MPDTTPILQLPYILPSQAQKHVTHNEAIRVLDVLVQLAVTARNISEPPASPSQGDRYIVAAGASGAWAGKVGQIALYENGAWQFFVASEGWTAWVTSEQVLASYNGAVWVSQADAPLSVGQLGISATADANNRLSLSSPATLLNHAGAGHQVKVNKAAAGDTASLLFQTGFSGRAEMGTAGNDDFAIKVSADGASFVTGLSIAATSGAVTLPAALRLGGQASDPAAPPNGTIWLNSTTGEVKMHSAGATVVIASGGVGLIDGDKGDVTVSASGTVWTVDAAAITNAKLANMPSATFKGRVAAGSGPATDITPAEATSILPAFTATEKGLAPASGGGTVNFLRADGIWTAPAGGGGGATLPDLGISATATQLNTAASAFPNALLLGETTNLAKGAGEVASASAWPESVVASGVTATKTATGFAADGTPWVEYTVNGTATTTGAITLFTQGTPFASAATGQTFTFGAVMSLSSGSAIGAVGARLDLQGYSALTGGTFLETTTTPLVNSGQSGVTQASYTLVNAGTVGVRLLALLRLAIGAVFTNAVYRFSAIQLDRGTSRLAYRYLPATSTQVRAALGQGQSSLVILAGSSVDFTGIPSTARRVTVLFSGLSTNGTTVPLIQLGAAGGIEASGYAGSVGVATILANTSSGVHLSTTWAASAVLQGSIVLNLMDLATNLWVFSGIAGRSDAAYLHSVCGSKALSGVLNQIRITAGANSFDAGTAAITWE